METIQLKQAIAQISELLEKAFAGEEIIITKNDKECIKISLMPLTKQRPPLFGSDQNLIWIADDFDEPLAEFE